MTELYKISEDLLNIFNEIENTEGEITDKQYDALCIKQDELKEKLEDYVKAVKIFQSNADFCKKEKQSINDRQNVYKNRVERLKKAMLVAVNTFGENGKTNKFIELPTCKIFTKNTTAVNVNTDRINILIELLKEYISEHENVASYSPVTEILSNINEKLATYIKNIEPFTMNDLETVNVNISTTYSVYNLFAWHNNILSEYVAHQDNCDITDATTKDNIKDNILKYGASEISVGSIATNNSLLIK